MIDFIKEHYQWFFSGAGVTIILLIISFFRKKGLDEEKTKIRQRGKGTIVTGNNNIVGNKNRVKRSKDEQ